MFTELKSDGAVVTIQSLGAELQSIKDIFGTEYLWQGDPAFWTGRAPVLFPVVGKLKDGKYTHEGKEYQMGSHGFARRSEFQMLSKTENHVDFLLQSNEETLRQYPFPFQLIVSYTLKGTALTVAYTVKNTGNGDMLFCIGGHPGINVPLLEDEKFEDYDIVFEKNECLYTRLVNENVYFSGETREILHNERVVPMTHSLFDHDAIVPVSLESRSACLRSRKSGRGMQIDFDGFATMAFWSQKGPAPFVCLEPWIGMAADQDGTYELKDKRDVITLGAGKVFNVNFTLTLL